MNKLLNPWFILVLLTCILGLIGFNYGSNNPNDRVNKTIFNVLSIVFLFIFCLHAYQKGTVYGIYMTLFLWAFFVCSVPIPQVALLLSFPLKHFFQITMETSQFFISCIAFMMLLCFHYYKKSLLQSHKIGLLFETIMKKQLYFIFILSIVASIIGSFLIDVFVDIYVLPKSENEKEHQERDIYLGIVGFVFLVGLYFYYCKINGIRFNTM